MCSGTMGSQRTWSVIVEPNSPPESGLFSWKNWGSLSVSCLDTNRNPLARWKEPIRKLGVFCEPSIQRTRRIQQTPCITQPHAPSSMRARVSTSLFPWNTNPIVSCAINNWFRWSEKIWECTQMFVTSGTKNQADCHVSTRIHPDLHFPEHTAAYKRGCHRLQF